MQHAQNTISASVSTVLAIVQSEIYSSKDDEIRRDIMGTTEINAKASSASISKIYREIILVLQTIAALQIRAASGSAKTNRRRELLRV